MKADQIEAEIAKLNLSKDALANVQGNSASGQLIIDYRGGGRVQDSIYTLFEEFNIIRNDTNWNITGFIKDTRNPHNGRGPFYLSLDALNNSIKIVAGITWDLPINHPALSVTNSHATGKLNDYLPRECTSSLIRILQCTRILSCIFRSNI